MVGADFLRTARQLLSGLAAARQGWRDMRLLATFDAREMKDLGFYGSDFHAALAAPPWRDPTQHLARISAEAREARRARMPEVDMVETYTPGHGPGSVAFMARRGAESHAGFLLPHLRPDMRILDCGCGPGTIALGLARRLPEGEVVGLDRSIAQTASARDIANRENLPLRFMVGNAYDPPFSDASFDGIIGHALIEHLATPTKAIQGFRRLLRPGGFVGLRSPDWGGFLVHPSQPQVSSALDRYQGLMRAGSGDPLAGRRLPGLLREGGFARVECSASYEIYERPSEIAEYLALQIAPNNPAEADALREWAGNPDALFAQAWVEAIGWADPA